MRGLCVVGGCKGIVFGSCGSCDGLKEECYLERVVCGNYGGGEGVEGGDEG